MAINVPTYIHAALMILAISGERTMRCLLPRGSGDLVRDFQFELDMHLSHAFPRPRASEDTDLHVKAIAIESSIGIDTGS
jgi:hypothetical protein